MRALRSQFIRSTAGWDLIAHCSAPPLDKVAVELCYAFLKEDILMRKALAALLLAAPLAALAEGPWLHGTLDEAVAAAAKEKKVVTLKFYADW